MKQWKRPEPDPRDRDYANHHVLEINREAMHTPLGAYASREQALAGDRLGSPFVKKLDGRWSFRLYDSPEAVPAACTAADFDTSDWDLINVPGTWETQGHGYPIYTNEKYPFAIDDPGSPHLGRPYAETNAAESEVASPDPAAPREMDHYGGFVLRPPAVPDDNPTGCYVTDFTVDPEWAGREITISFEGVESAFYLNVNGVCVGYGQDSKLPSEFMITDAVRPGSNRLAVRVIRFSDGSYLEDQDYWHVSGIHRSVILYAKPAAHIRDFRVRTHIDLTTTQTHTDGSTRYRADAVLDLVCSIREVPGFASHQVRCELLDPEGAAIATATAPVSVDSPMYAGRTGPRERAAASLQLPVSGVMLWSDETPVLYRAVLTLIGPAGTETDWESARIGFRDIRKGDDGVIRLNGERLVVRGVDRHEHDPQTGRRPSVQRMREEIVAMKRLNFNAVRTSHYPNDTAWYDLCDELGIIVVDEANLETHGLGTQLSSDPSWAHAYLDRAVRMVLRDRNHPCVCFWSLGNESGVGPNHAAMAAWIRSFDPTRLVQYESGDPGPEVTDLRAPMYPRVDWVEQTLSDPEDPRPMVMCEYAYAKSNSNGGVAKYWDLVRRFPRFQGGFVWDWCDKSLPVTGPNGELGYGYGGDFGEPVVNEKSLDMCLNGVVQPDLTPHPGAHEIMYLQAPVRLLSRTGGPPPDRSVSTGQPTADLAAGAVEVRNEYHTTNIEGMLLDWTLLRDGEPAAHGSLTLPSIAPGRSTDLQIPWREALEDASDEAPRATTATPVSGRLPHAMWHVNLDLRLAADLPWAPAGHVVAFEQFDVTAAVLAADPGVTGTMGRAGVMELGRNPPLSANPQVTGNAPVAPEAPLRGRTDHGRPWPAALRIRDDGLLTSSTGGPLLRGGAGSFFRATTGIDRGVGGDSYANDWYRVGLDRLVRRLVSVEGTWGNSADACVTVCARYETDGFARFEQRTVYEPIDRGAVAVEETIYCDPGLPVLPRIGVTYELDAAYGRLEWLGRGPHESYPDRKHSARIGRHASTVDEQHHDFIVPVECGGKEDVTWIKLSNSAGGGIAVSSDVPLHVSALRHSVAEYEAARHEWDLPESDTIYLGIDHRHLGLGGDVGWYKCIDREHLIEPGVFGYRFVIQIVGGEEL